jgi:hypothetical protein
MTSAILTAVCNFPLEVKAQNCFTNVGRRLHSSWNNPLLHLMQQNQLIGVSP